MDFPQAVPVPVSETLDDEDRELAAMALRAVEYVSTFSWLRKVDAANLAFGIAGILVLVQVWITADEHVPDEMLWVVAGDLPSAYFVVDDAPDVGTALAVYCELMRDWADAVLQGTDMNEVYPVDAPPTEGNAKDLISRMSFIEDQIIPNWPDFG